MLKGLGTASDAVGKFVGSIPVVKEGTVDEFLQDKGVKLKKDAIGMEKAIVEDFSRLCNPGTNKVSGTINAEPASSVQENVRTPS